MTPEEIEEGYHKDLIDRISNPNSEHYGRPARKIFLKWLIVAQREAVEKTQDAMLKFIFSLGGASMVDISEVTKAIFEITPEKVLLTKE